MTKRDKVKLLPSRLEELYPVVICDLIADTDYELLFATILSAQCTDIQVNKVTKKLFSEFDTLEKFANASFADVYKHTKSCGIAKKAGYIVDSARILLTEYNGKVPDTIEEIIKLPGAGRKTANLIIGEFYGKPAIIADTHCIRLSNRFGLVSSEKDTIVERELKKIIPKYKQTKFCHRLVRYGRDVCKSQKPLCHLCTLTEFCKFYKSH